MKNSHFFNKKGKNLNFQKKFFGEKNTFPKEFLH